MIDNDYSCNKSYHFLIYSFLFLPLEMRTFKSRLSHILLLLLFRQLTYCDSPNKKIYKEANSICGD